MSLLCEIGSLLVMRDRWDKRGRVDGVLVKFNSDRIVKAI